MEFLAVRPRGRKRWAAVVAMLLALLAAFAHAAAVRDYQVEAVFLFNFTQFVEWPSAAFAGEQEPIVIGVLGDDPFDGYLDATVRGETVAGRSLVVRRYRRAEEIDACQVLFISRSEADRLDQAFSRAKSRSILTVSDADSFIERGGMVAFVLDNGHVRLRINADAARAAGLTISSKLLRVAEIAAPDNG
jgi:hypothetical protein